MLKKKSHRHLSDRATKSCNFTKKENLPKTNFEDLEENITSSWQLNRCTPGARPKVHYSRAAARGGKFAPDNSILVSGRGGG